MILIDDLDTDKLAHFLKRWADKYACKGEAKGYTVPLQHDVICITSNFSMILFSPKHQSQLGSPS